MINQIDLYFKRELDKRKPSRVVEAMEYSLMSGGKRVRPLMLLYLVKDLGYELDKKSYYAAMSVEAIHTYSLIHDDLPALDNDDLRRFKPTNHIVYGEDMAILAGDGLLTLGFELLSEARLDARFFEVLGRNAGISGMILGQELDILDEISNLDALLNTYSLKTGCLFSSALEMAVLLADKEHLLEEIKEIGRLLGIVFQIQDDLLEVKSSEDMIGKSTTSDEKRDLTTIVSFMGVNEAENFLETLFKDLFKKIDKLDLQGTEFKEYVSALIDRSY